MFRDDFEDGTLDNWSLTISQNLKEITALTAANGTRLSYRQTNRQTGHFNGIFREFGEEQPGYAGFWIRSSSSETNDAYFILRDQNLNESIFFFAQENGFLYVNLDVGGNAAIPYEAEKWYFIEFRNIDFATHTFDYWVNDNEIATAIPFRFGQTSQGFQRLELYNFDNEAVAWWDEIIVSKLPPPGSIRVNPSDGVVAAGESLDIVVTFDSRGLAAGDHFSNIVVESNDPDDPIVLVSTLLNVLGAPHIDLPERPPEFATVFIGRSATHPLVI